MSAPSSQSPCGFPTSPVTKHLPRNWSARRINRALRERGITHTALARQLGRGRSSVSLVVAGVTKSAYIAQAIAEALGTTPDVIWPRLYPAGASSPGRNAQVVAGVGVRTE